MQNSVGRSLVALTLSAIVAVAGAQSSEPFYDSTRELSQAYGMEMVNLRMMVIEAFEPPVPDELLEQIEEIFESDLRRFAGSLAENDKALHDELVASLEEFEETVEAGGDPDGPINEVRRVLSRVRETLIEAELRNSPTFTAALVANLLLLDDGVAEAYEDAAEDELWEFPAGWAALQRVRQLWTHLERSATDGQRADVQEMFDFLAAIYPDPNPPEAITGSPEEAEAPAHRVVGLLEGMTGASLVPGRHLARLAGHSAQTVAPSCEAYAQGRDHVAVEGVFAIADAYDKHLGRLLDLVAPETHLMIIERIEALVAEEPAEGAEILCRELEEALREAQSALGG